MNPIRGVPSDASCMPSDLPHGATASVPTTCTPADTEDVILTDVNWRNALSAQPDWGGGGGGRGGGRRNVTIMSSSSWAFEITFLQLSTLKKPFIMFIAAVSGG